TPNRRVQIPYVHKTDAAETPEYRKAQLLIHDQQSVSRRAELILAKRTQGRSAACAELFSRDQVLTGKTFGDADTGSTRPHDLAAYLAKAEVLCEVSQELDR